MHGYPLLSGSHFRILFLMSFVLIYIDIVLSFFPLYHLAISGGRVYLAVAISDWCFSHFFIKEVRIYKKRFRFSLYGPFLVQPSAMCSSFLNYIWPILSIVNIEKPK